MAAVFVQVVVATMQLQPVPAMAVAVRPVGSVSATVTMPEPPVAVFPLLVPEMV